jgi:phage RecT family recombinase
MAKNLPDKVKTPQDLLMDSFRDDLADIVPYLVSLLGKDRVGRFQRMSQFAVLRDMGLLNCTKKSLLLALLWCAQKNLEPGVEDGCWILPFKVKGVLTATPVPGYKGLINRAVEVGAVLKVDAYPVYEYDEFSYHYGLEPDVTHVPPKLGEDRGDMIGAYVVMVLPNGEPKFLVMDRPAIEKHRNAGAAWRNSPDSGPWKDWEEGMFLKTVIKQGLKTVPMKSDLRDLLAEDGLIETGASVAALAEAAALESGKVLPKELQGADEELVKAQEKLAASKADTSEFDALVAKEFEGLPEDEVKARYIRLEENVRLTAASKNIRKTIPMFKNFVVPYFHPYTDGKGEEKEGYWKAFLRWEADPARPWHKMGEGGEGPGQQEGGEGPDPEAPAPFDERKRAVTMECLRKIIAPADLGLEALSDISEENIVEIEAKVAAWGEKKKK